MPVETKPSTRPFTPGCRWTPSGYIWVTLSGKLPFRLSLGMAEFLCLVISVNVCISGPNSHYLPRITFIVHICFFNKDLF